MLFSSAIAFQPNFQIRQEGSASSLARAVSRPAIPGTKVAKLLIDLDKLFRVQNELP